MKVKENIKIVTTDLKTHWRTPAASNYVSYKEVAALSVGHMGQRLATTFGLTQEAFVCNTLGMSQMQRVGVGYVTTVLSLLKNLLNGYILDNHRSPKGKFRCYIPLAIPAGIILLLALLFVPFDEMANVNKWYMIIAAYGIDQVQGYISGWFGTGVAGLNQVITPNTTERTRVIAVEGIILNIAPTITDIAVSMLKEYSYGFYDIRSFRVAYAPFIVIGTLLTLLSYFGTKERLQVPKTHMTSIGFIEAFRQVSRNKIFWIRMFDGWNDFLEGAKGNILSYVYTYGEVSKGASNVGLKYGLARDAVGSASLIAMIMTPTVVTHIGKGRYKFYKNIIQTFLLFGIGWAYKKHILLLILFLWLDKIVDTATVIDYSIEADMKDYQHYLSGERIDGAFSVVKLYMNTAINAVTDLFLPLVKKKYGLTDNYDDLHDETFRNTILDVMMKISIIGAVIDCVPYYFYDISENDMKGIEKVLKLRAFAEDNTDITSWDTVPEELKRNVQSAFNNRDGEIPVLSKEELKRAKKLPRGDKSRFHAVKAAKADYKSTRTKRNEAITSAFMLEELLHYETAFGKAKLRQAQLIVQGGFNNFRSNSLAAEQVAQEYQVTDKKTKREQKELLHIAAGIERSLKFENKYYPDGLIECNPYDLEKAVALPTGTSQQRKERRLAIKSAENERKRYSATCKAFLLAQRELKLAEGYMQLLSLCRATDKV